MKTKLMKDKWDKIAYKWVSHLKEFNKWQIDERLSFVKLLKGNKILDLGCGSGRDMKFFNSLGFKCNGIDFCEKMCEIAGENSICGNIINLPFKNNNFNGAWCISVAKFLSKKDFLIFINEVYRVLKKEGVFLLGLDYGDGIIELDRESEKLQTQLYSLETLLPLINKFKFKECVIKRTNDRDFLIITLTK